MLNSTPVAIIAGTMFGFLAGLGVGGGTLLILWLTLVLGTDHTLARGINLLFFLPTALISSAFHHRKGTLRLQPLIPAMIAGCLFAAVFSVIGMQMNLSLMKKLFGVLLIITGLRELFYRRRKAR